MHGQRPAQPPQHPNQHRARRLVLLAVDQELGERAALRVAPELTDTVGSLEVRQHEDVEQPGPGSRPERVQALTNPALELVGSHGLGDYAGVSPTVSPPGRSETPTHTRCHERVSVEGIVAL